MFYELTRPMDIITVFQRQLRVTGVQLDCENVYPSPDVITLILPGGILCEVVCQVVGKPLVFYLNMHMIDIYLIYTAHLNITNCWRFVVPCCGFARIDFNHIYFGVSLLAPFQSSKCANTN